MRDAASGKGRFSSESPKRNTVSDPFQREIVGCRECSHHSIKTYHRKCGPLPAGRASLESLVAIQSLRPYPRPAPNSKYFQMSKNVLKSLLINWQKSLRNTWGEERKKNVQEEKSNRVLVHLKLIFVVICFGFVLFCFMITLTSG